MKVDILASGSTGNAIAITSGFTTILIDCGIAKTKIEKALMSVDISPDNINAIFITHNHIDHVRGITLANKYHIPVHAGSGEWKNIKGVDDDLINHLIPEGVLFDHEGLRPWLEVIPFKSQHDSADPMGYVVQSEDHKISICLDTGIVDEIMLEEMKGSDTYIIESNHDRKMVEASSYPNSVKARILSHVGHLSNQQTADALFQLIEGKGETIYLSHLSNKNNMPGLARMTVMKKLKEKGFVAGKHYHLEVV